MVAPRPQAPPPRNVDSTRGIELDAHLRHLLQGKLPVYYQSKEADFTQAESSLPLLFVFSLSNLPPIRKLPTRLRVHQGKVAVWLLFLWFVSETTEEPLPSLVKPLSNLLGNLGV